MRYLQGTKNYILTYKRSDDLFCIGYSNSNFVGCPDDKKLTFGYVFMVAIWLKNFISKFNLIESILKPLIIYCDNTAIMNFSQNNKNFAGTKHFDIKYQFIRKKIREHLTCIKHVFTDCILVDPLIKCLTIKIFKRLVIRMGLVKSFDVLS